MIRGVWHSVTLDGDIADVESFIDERGFAMLFDLKDWWTHNGYPVYAGKHVQAEAPDRVEAMCAEMRNLAAATNNQPNARHIKVIVDALR